MPEEDTGIIYSSGESIPSRREIVREVWRECPGNHVTERVGSCHWPPYGSPKEDTELNKNV